MVFRLTSAECDALFRNDAAQGLENGRVATLRQLNQDFVGLALLAIIPSQLRAQPPRLHADNWIASLVESRTLTENFDADDEFLETLAAASQRFIDGKTQESLQAVGLAKHIAREDSFQLRCDLLVRILPGFAAGLRGHIREMHRPYSIIFQQHCVFTRRAWRNARVIYRQESRCSPTENGIDQ